MRALFFLRRSAVTRGDHIISPVFVQREGIQRAFREGRVSPLIKPSPGRDTESRVLDRCRGDVYRSPSQIDAAIPSSNVMFETIKINNSRTIQTTKKNQPTVGTVRYYREIKLFRPANVGTSLLIKTIFARHRA